MAYCEELLARSRNLDGGWGYAPGQPSTVEPTAYAAMALVCENAPGVDSALEWLARARNPDGGWGHLPADGESAWQTSLALLARAAAGDPIDDRGVAFLLGNRSRAVTLSRESPIAVNVTLRGWPWTPRTFAWVEPTSYALIALKRAGVSHTAIEEGELLLIDRQCAQGGWNYGNVRPLGVPLSPYPYTTAVALLALRSRRPKGLDRALTYLEEFTEADVSAFDLAWAILALDAYGRGTDRHRARLTDLREDDGSWDHSTLHSALAAIALAIKGSTNPLAT